MDPAGAGGGGRHRRGNRGPAWLAKLGYPGVPADVVRAGLFYATREYRRIPGAEDFTGVIVAHHPGNPTDCGTAAVEDDRWIVAMVGIGDDAPPTEPGAFEEFAAGVDGWELGELVRTAVPLRFRIGSIVRLRYERCARLPEGFLPIGDALCCFNPAYGQGMTAAALAVRSLRECLRTGTGGLTRRYVNRLRRIIDAPWDITVGNDLRFPGVTGPAHPSGGAAQRLPVPAATGGRDRPGRRRDLPACGQLPRRSTAPAVPRHAGGYAARSASIRSPPRSTRRYRRGSGPDRWLPSGHDRRQPW
jgi:hypothetical protein